MANVLARNTLQETSVMKLNLDTMNSQIPHVVNVTQNTMDSLIVMLVVVMNMEPLMTSVPTTENVLAKLTSKATVVINASLLSMVSLIAKLVNVMPRDQSLLILAMSPENVLASPTLLETSVTNAQKVLA